MRQISLEKIEFALNSYEVKNEFALYENTLDNLDSKTMVCTNCLKAGGCRRHTGYSRYFVTVEKDMIVAHYIKVPRRRCKYCNKTFSVIPGCVSYSSSYSQSFVLNVMRDYKIRRFENIVLLCEYYQIAVSTLYEWLRKPGPGF